MATVRSTTRTLVDHHIDTTTIAAVVEAIECHVKVAVCQGERSYQELHELAIEDQDVTVSAAGVDAIVTAAYAVWIEHDGVSSEIDIELRDVRRVGGDFRCTYHVSQS